MNPNDLSPPTEASLARSLSRHLNGYAVGLDVTTDPEAVLVGMRRVDRNRRIRAIGAGGCLFAILAFGFLALGGGEDRAADLDVRGDAPSPLPDDPSLVPGTVEQTGSGDRSTDDSSDPSGPIPDSDAREDRVAGSDDDGINRLIDGDDSGVPDHLQVDPITTTTSVAVETTTTTVAVESAPQPPTTTAAPATTTTVAAVSFSAVSRYGSCEEDPPYDEYSGTATPGTVVTITSPWSATAQTTADGSGNWYLRVEFPSAPVGEVFTVTASDGSGASVGMSFVRTA